MKTFKEGKRAGYVDITTRVPSQVLEYMKHSIAPSIGGSLTEMFIIMLTQWLKEHPWENGLPWRETKALSHRSKTIETVQLGDGTQTQVPVYRTVGTGWVQVNMRIPEELSRRVKSLAHIHTVTPSSALYTAIFWWAWLKNPPPEVAARRRIEREERLAQQRKRMSEPTHCAEAAFEIVEQVRKGVPSS